jgi:hypothetical protein
MRSKKRSIQDKPKEVGVYYYLIIEKKNQNVSQEKTGRVVSSCLWKAGQGIMRILAFQKWFLTLYIFFSCVHILYFDKLRDKFRKEPLALRV